MTSQEIFDAVLPLHQQLVELRDRAKGVAPTWGVVEIPDGTKVWLLFDHKPTPDTYLLFFAQLPDHIRWLPEGRLFASREARDKYQDALVKLANGETK